jgi:hypothetical protein
MSPPRRRPAHQRPRLAGALAGGAASGIEALALAFAELAHDVRQLSGRVDAMTAPQRPPKGFIALKVAAWSTGLCVESLRLKAVNREVPALRIGGKWFVKIEKLEDSKPSPGGKVAA